MIPMRNVSAAVLLAAILAMPGTAAFAATTPAADTARLTVGAKSELLPVANLVNMIGSWSAGDLATLDKAADIKTFDTKALYPAADQAKIVSAETSKASQLGKFRDAIRADAGLSAWLAANKIDVNRVIAVADPHGRPEIFLN